jgi:hypothetical protein
LSYRVVRGLTRAFGRASKNSSGRTSIRPPSRNTARGASRIRKVIVRPQYEAGDNHIFLSIFFFFDFFFMAMIHFLLV